MIYENMDAYLEITFPNGNIRRIKKSLIKEFLQYKNSDGQNYVFIYVQDDSYRFEGTFEDLEKNSKTVFI